MAFDPALTTAIDRMRDALGDVNDAAPYKPDATYTAYLATNGNDERKATIALAEAMIVQYGLEPDEVVVENGETTKWADKVKVWRDLVARLRGEIELEQTRASGGLRTLRPTRGDCRHGEYYAGGRVLPWED